MEKFNELQEQAERAKVPRQVGCRKGRAMRRQRRGIKKREDEGGVGEKGEKVRGGRR